MPLDVSYHPVDCELVERRLIPYLQGDGEIEDLVEEAAERVLVRRRAKAQALALAELLHPSPAQLAPTEDAGDDETQLDIDRSTVSFRAASGLAAGRVQGDLHLWGRPFLIASHSTGEVVETYGRYLGATRSSVDDLARNQAGELLPEGAGVPFPTDQANLDPERTKWELSWKLQLLRESYSAYQEDALISISDSLEVHPLDLLASELSPTLLHFLSALRPGWMAQGYSWPSFLFTAAGLELPTFLGSFDDLLEPFLQLVPEIRDTNEPTLGDSSRIGAYVRPADIPALSAYLAESRPQLQAWADADGWGTQCQSVLHKLEECIAYADHHGMGFVEASHVYNVPFGLWN